MAFQIDDEEICRPDRLCRWIDESKQLLNIEQQTALIWYMERGGFGMITQGTVSTAEHHQCALIANRALGHSG